MGPPPPVPVRPPVSEFGSVDAAPAALETDVALLRKQPRDAGLPVFERFPAIFALRPARNDAAAFALGEAVLRDASALVRHACAYLLGPMQRPASVPRLVNSLRHEAHPMVRHEAAEALGAIGTEEVVPILERSRREDPAVEVRESCEVALAQLSYLRDPRKF